MESTGASGICRLCLQSRANLMDAVENSTQEMLKLLIPIIDVHLSINPKLCNNCFKELTTSCEFKTACLTNRESIEMSNLDPKPTKMCSLCQKRMETIQAMDTVKKEDEIYFKVVLDKCLPELGNLDVTTLCETCVGSLKYTYNFIIKCIETEENIQNYCTGKYLDFPDKVDLPQVAKFLSDKIEKLQPKSPPRLVIKLYDILNQPTQKTHIENVKKEEETVLKTEEVEFTLKEEPAESQSDLKVYKMKDDNASIYNCKLCPVTARTRKDIKFRYEEIHRSKKPPKTKSDDVRSHKDVYKFNCGDCDFKTTRMSRLKRHQLKHKDPSEIDMHKCSICPYATIHKGYLKNHVLAVHEKKRIKNTLYTCDICQFTTYYKLTLASHCQRHKDPSEAINVYVYKFHCGDCDFKTTTMSKLKRHQLKHKDPSEIDMHKCSMCLFESKYAAGLLAHQNNMHRDQSTVKKHECPRCPFVSIHKSYIRTHVLRVHEGKRVKNILYTCDICRFTTYDKHTLESHFLRHRDSSEMFKCSLCPYESKINKTLKNHIKVQHSDAGYNCEICAFKTKYWNRFTEHMLRHKAPSELPTYKCDKCSYGTNIKRYLRQHVKVHQDPATSKYLMCDICSYTTKRRNYLRNHMATHPGTRLGQGKTL